MQIWRNPTWPQLRQTCQIGAQYLCMLANYSMRLLLLCTAGIVYASGSHPSPQSRHMTPKLVYANAQCTLDSVASDVQSRWVASQAQLDQLYSQLYAQALGANKSAAPTIDFKNYGVVLVQMGQKRSAGYRLELPAQELVVKAGAMKLQVNWIEPAPGAMVAQVITHPCLLVSVPLADFHRLDVVDQHQQVRTSLSR
jgi:hypothetical protein